LIEVKELRKSYVYETKYTYLKILSTCINFADHPLYIVWVDCNGTNPSEIFPKFSNSNKLQTNTFLNCIVESQLVRLIVKLHGTVNVMMESFKLIQSCYRIEFQVYAFITDQIIYIEIHI
jgi:hypothetical protein